MTSSSNSTAGREKPGVPRVTLTVAEAASVVGVSKTTFRRAVLPYLPIIQLGPRLTLIRTVELERWLERSQEL